MGISMMRFTINANEYLSCDIRAFYHVDYVGFRRSGNPDFLNYLKNDYRNQDPQILRDSRAKLYDIIVKDLPAIQKEIKIYPLTVCVVPRAKEHNCYSENQLFFLSTISSAVNAMRGFYDGTRYIIRHTSTKTTHLGRNATNFSNYPSPYPGITKSTCYISEKVRGRDILLIDDIYTKTVNIDEDAIEALLSNGAKSVTFYAIAKTVANRHLLIL